MRCGKANYSVEMTYLAKSLVNVGVLQGSCFGPLLVVGLLLRLVGNLQGTVDRS